MAVSILSLLISSIAFASEKKTNLCLSNLNKIEQHTAVDSITMGEPNRSQIHELRIQAESFEKNGDIKGCIANTEQALLILNQYHNKQ